MIGSVLRGCARRQFLALADLLPPENDAGGGEGVAVAPSNCASYLIGFPVLAHITLLISAEWFESQILMCSAGSLSTCVPFDPLFGGERFRHFIRVHRDNAGDYPRNLEGWLANP
jgi:hypothetical protein